ncbi:hypothetical protein HZZ00_19220 [Streptomyces sp. NEAU-sy36]|nr:MULTISPECIES: hypothetical protein [unclassified Streptomyces]QLJ02922.1 hypothetical protein HZZ00_19220 [Streptomyces sp. NEAU-sy36]
MNVQVVARPSSTVCSVIKAVHGAGLLRADAVARSVPWSSTAAVFHGMEQRG